MEHWWDKIQYQCPNCKEYNCFLIAKETKTWYQKRCKKCGFWGYKKEISFAEYKHKDGKIFLKRNGWKRFEEVELVDKNGRLWVSRKQDLEVPTMNLFNDKIK